MLFSGIRIIESFELCGSKGVLKVLENGVIRCYILQNLLFAKFSMDPFDLGENTLDVLDVFHEIRSLEEKDFELLEFIVLEERVWPKFHHLVLEGNGSLHLIFEDYSLDEEVSVY